MKFIILIIITMATICLSAQVSKSPPIDDSIQLRIITKRQQEFPNVSIVFEALHHNKIIVIRVKI